MAKFGDTYTLTAEADVKELDQVVDALRDMGDATDYVGDTAAGIASNLKKAELGMYEVGEGSDKAKRGIDDMGKEAEETGGILSKLGSVGGTALKGLLGFTALGGLSFAGVFGAGLQAALEMDGALGQLQAQTGRLDWEMEGIQQLVEGLYIQNLGDSLTDVAQAVATMQRETNNWNVDFLEQMTGDALILNEVFGYDVQQSARAATLLMEQFGIEGGAAFDMITRAAQFAGDPSNDLLEGITENAVVLAEMGFTAEEAMSLLTSGVDAGAKNYQKVGDAIKDMNAKVRSGEADLALWSLGLDYMKRQWVKGEIGADEFFTAVQDGLKDIEDPLARARWGTALFGSKWEDLGEQVFLSMNTYSDAFYDLEDATAKAHQTMSRGLQPAWNKFIRSTRVAINTALTPLISKFLDVMVPAMDTFVIWLRAVGLPALTAFAYQIGDVISAVVEFGQQSGIFEFIGRALEMAAGFLGDVVNLIAHLSPESIIAIGAALAVMAGPAVIGSVVTGLSGIVGLLGTAVASLPLIVGLGIIAAYETNFGGLKDHVRDMVDAIEEGDVVGFFEGLGGALSAIPKGAADELGQALFGWDEGEMQTRLDVWKEIPGYIGGIGDGLGKIALDKLDGLADSLTEKLVDPFKNAVADVTKRLTGTEGASLATVITIVVGLIKNQLFSGLGTILGDVLTSPFGKTVLDIADKLMGDGAESLKAKVGALPSQIGTWLVGLGASLIDVLMTPFDEVVLAVAGKLLGEDPDSLKTKISGIPSALFGWLTSLGNELRTWLFTPFWGTVLSIIDFFFGEDNPGSLVSKLKALPGSIADWVKDLPTTAENMARGFVDAFIAIFRTLAPMLVAVLNDAIPDYVDFGSIGTPFGTIDFGSIDLPDNPIPVPSLDRGGAFGPGAYFVGRGAQPELFITNQSGVAYPRGSYDLGGTTLTINGGLHLHGVQDVPALKRALEAEARRQNQHGGRGV